MIDGMSRCVMSRFVSEDVSALCCYVNGGVRLWFAVFGYCTVHLHRPRTRAGGGEPTKSYRVKHRLGGPPLCGAGGVECLSIAVPTRAWFRFVKSNLIFRLHPIPFTRIQIR